MFNADALTTLAVNATLNGQGGWTINPHTHGTPTSGYAVALPGAEVIVKAGTADELRKAYSAYLDRFMGTINSATDVYFGGWVSTDSQGETVIYLDLSVVVTTKTEAEAYAEDYKQLAYYDFQTASEVQVYTYEDEAARDDHIFRNSAY